MRSTRCIRRSRFRIRGLPISSSAGAAQIIADNACAHLFVLGRSQRRRTGARSIWSRKGRSSALRGKQYIGHGKNVLGDPRVALAWLANELRQLGVTLKAGEVVTTGTCHPPLPIQSGDLFAADFGVLGKVSVRVSSQAMFTSVCSLRSHA